MNWQTSIGNGIKNAGDYAGKFLVNGSHAQQALPAQHRLLAAGGMFLGWIAMDKLRDVIFGTNQVSEGEFVDVKREDVPGPLRFLHKTIDWDPCSDAPEEQWKKLAHQMIPAVGAAVGTVVGSMYAFELNGRAQDYVKFKGSKSPLLFMDAEMGAQYANSRSMRILTAATGGFAAASMMPLIYGSFLNMAFASANGARIFTGDLAMGNSGPAKALGGQLGVIPNYVKAALKSNGQVSEAWADGFVKKVLNPMFGKNLKNPEAQAEVRHKIQKILQDAFDKHKGEGLNPDKFAAAVEADMKKIFGNNKDGKGFDKAIEMLGLRKEDAKLGRGIPLVSDFNEFLGKFGVGKDTNAASWMARTQANKSAATSSPVMGGV